MRSRVARADSCEPSKLDTALAVLVVVVVGVGDVCACGSEVAWVNMGVGRLKEETVVLVVDICELDERETLAPADDKECDAVSGSVVDVVTEVTVLLAPARISET